MLPKKFSLILVFSIILTLGLSISLGSLLAAWTAPASSPPEGNIASPINTSATGQAKQGGLILNTGGSANGLIVQSGNVGIGTLDPKAKLDVAGPVKIGSYLTTARPVCNADLLGSFIFDLTENKPYVCASGGIWKSLNSDCGPVQRANGEVCSSDGECISGFCTDWTCCNSACTGSACQRCDSYSVNGAGTCGYVSSSAQDPDYECPGAFGACASTNCSGSGYSCGYLTGQQSCATCTTCSGSSYSCSNTAAGSQPTGCTGCYYCNGAGACDFCRWVWGFYSSGLSLTSYGTSYPCTWANIGYMRNSSQSAGPTTCTTTGCWFDMVAGNYDVYKGTCICNSSADCSSNGTACSTANQCCSGFCADGVCCNTACTGSTCQRCDSYSVSGAGTCGYISTAVDPDNECVPQDSTSSNGCATGNCSGTEYVCGGQSTGDGSCPACQKCADTDAACEYYAVGVKDSVAPNTCTAIYYGCDGSGNCGNPKTTYGYCRSGDCCGSWARSDACPDYFVKYINSLAACNARCRVSCTASEQNYAADCTAGARCYDSEYCNTGNCWTKDYYYASGSYYYYCYDFINLD